MRLLKEKIMIVQPQTPEDVDALSEDIHSAASLLPNYDPDFLDDEFTGGMRLYPEQFVLVYYDGDFVGYIEFNDNTSFVHLGRDTIEFGGVILPEYRACDLIRTAAKLIIRDAFRRTGKKKMLSFADPADAHAVAGLKLLGFRHVGRDKTDPDKKRMMYILNRKDALYAKENLTEA